MIPARQTELYAGSQEEYFPDLDPGFPYLPQRAEPDRFPVPWHWHRSVELFYMESGTLEYSTPGGVLLFPPGSGGLVNSNVLHRTRPVGGEPVVQLLHLFEPALLAGIPGGAIEEKYILPLTADPALELIPLFPEEPRHRALLAEIKTAFSLSPAEFGYEIRLREALSRLWLGLLGAVAAPPDRPAQDQRANDKLKTMMVYVHRHYADKLTVAELAAAGFVSQRECFRLFQARLRLTPMAYVQSYRLQTACRMLALGEEPVTAVALACGLGSASYFSALFRRQMGCTPLQYRRDWQNIDKNRQKTDGFPAASAVL